MTTQVLKINNDSLEKAKKIIKEGGLVAFPTETVYGLGALATSDEAVKRIYEVKGRPSDNPLIVHVHKDYDVSSLVEYSGGYAEKLRNAFLPGPLTIVYKSKGMVSPLVSCGLNTVAIRVPQSRAAQEFLKYVNKPIAAPSANISKHVSPVTAMHVYNDFNGKIPLILDGGRSVGGIESTVLDATGEIPVILRKGLVTAEMVKKVVGECVYVDDNSALKARSPGMKYSHYMPRSKTALFPRDCLKQAEEYYKKAESEGIEPVFMADGEIAEKLKNDGDFKILNLGKTDREMAENLYEALHEGESYGVIISVELNVNTEIMLGVNNRFSKAFGGGFKFEKESK